MPPACKEDANGKADSVRDDSVRGVLTTDDRQTIVTEKEDDAVEISADVPLEEFASRLDVDLQELRAGLRAASGPDEVRVLLEKNLHRRRIPARLAALLRREMRQDLASEDMRYIALINAFYADLDHVDPSGKAKAYVDGEMMKQPYMRGLYTRVVGGLRQALSDGDFAIPIDKDVR